MNKGTKAKVRKREKHITIIIVPSAGGNSKAVKIYYPKLVLPAVLCMAICGILMAGVFIRNIMHENHELRANNIQLHELNHAQLRKIKENDQKINDVINNNLKMQDKMQQLADLYKEIVQKYKGITERYILMTESQTLTSRSDGRSDKSFISDIISLQHKIEGINSILKLESSDGALSDSRLLVEHFAEALPDFTPLQGRISDRFGYRKDPFWKNEQFHSGLDIAAPYGSDIRSAGAGKVVFAGRKGGYGNLVIIDHGYGLTTYYGHASRLLVKEGQQVRKGEVIAKVGSTGRSTGPHLHFEIRINDVPIDPLKYIALEQLP